MNGDQFLTQCSLMLGQRRRRLANIKITLGQCIVFAGKSENIKGKPTRPLANKWWSARQTTHGNVRQHCKGIMALFRRSWWHSELKCTPKRRWGLYNYHSCLCMHYVQEKKSLEGPDIYTYHVTEREKAYDFNRYHAEIFLYNPRRQNVSMSL